MLELTNETTGQKFYIAPSHVVTVAAESGFDQYANILMAVGASFKVMGSARQIAENVSKALGEEMR